MKSSKVWMLVALLTLGSLLGVALAESAATQPAATDKQKCMEQCQAVSTSLADTLQVIAAAKASGKPEDLKAALDKAEAQLKAMQEKVDHCNVMMQKKHEHKKAEKPAAEHAH